MKKNLLTLCLLVVSFFCLHGCGESDYAIKTASTGRTTIAGCSYGVCATVGGDHSTEVYLVKNNDTDTYELHTYSTETVMIDEDGEYNFDNFTEETTHHAYQVTEEFVDSICQYIKKEKLVRMKNHKGSPICGGFYTLKFQYKGELIILDYENFDKKGMENFNTLESMLYEGVDEANKI